MLLAVVIHICAFWIYNEIKNLLVYVKNNQCFIGIIAGILRSKHCLKGILTCITYCVTAGIFIIPSPLTVGMLGKFNRTEKISVINYVVFSKLNLAGIKIVLINSENCCAISDSVITKIVYTVVSIVYKLCNNLIATCNKHVGLVNFYIQYII